MDIKNVRLPIISRIIPSILAYEILSVQPMPPSAGLIFTMTKNRFGKPMDPVLEPKYKFSRKWYTVNSKWHLIDTTEIHDWCVANFGRSPLRPDAWTRWYRRFNVFYFRDSEDYVLYCLRWGK
jgi:hypothetical protein